jgi:4,5-dihydroxyphthalate decarboxylase
MGKLKLSLACDAYLHTKALRDGDVEIEGVDLTYLELFPAETFQRMVQNKEFDASELGMKFCVSSRALESPPFIAVPVFPSRSFRHSAIYVNVNSKIETPRDLIGKRVGEPFAYGHDAAIWARGILADHYGVPVDSVVYVTGRLDSARSRDFAPFKPNKSIRVEDVQPHQTLDDMLESDEIDALYSGIVPPCFLKGSKNVRRLFEDFEQVERAYFKQTGVYPIMHTLGIRTEVYQQQRWLARSIYKAFCASRDKAYDYYAEQESSMLRLLMTPWMAALREKNRQLFGDDLWPYGLEKNRKAIETFIRYHHEQGLSERMLKAEDLFAPETLADYADYKAPILTRGT